MGWRDAGITTCLPCSTRMHTAETPSLILYLYIYICTYLYILIGPRFRSTNGFIQALLAWPVATLLLPRARGCTAPLEKARIKRREKQRYQSNKKSTTSKTRVSNRLAAAHCLFSTPPKGEGVGVGGRGSKVSQSNTHASSRFVAAGTLRNVGKTASTYIALKALLSVETAAFKLDFLSEVPLQHIIPQNVEDTPLSCVMKLPLCDDHIGTRTLINPAS